jgi:hypothetical protein
LFTKVTTRLPTVPLSLEMMTALRMSIEPTLPLTPCADSWMESVSYGVSMVQPDTPAASPTARTMDAATRAFTSGSSKSPRAGRSAD